MAVNARKGGFDDNAKPRASPSVIVEAAKAGVVKMPGAVAKRPGRLVVHVGPHKTGSSYMQGFLVHYKEWLSATFKIQTKSTKMTNAEYNPKARIEAVEWDRHERRLVVIGGIVLAHDGDEDLNLPAVEAGVVVYASFFAAA